MTTSGTSNSLPCARSFARAIRQFAAVLVALASVLPGVGNAAGNPPEAVARALAAGHPQDLIVSFDDSAIEAELRARRQKQAIRNDSAEVSALKETRYRALREEVRAAMPEGETETLLDYSHLPISLIRVKTKAALDQLTAHPRVRGMFINERKYLVLDSQSLGLIRQPQVAAAGLGGGGTNVVIIDTGATYGVADLGSCSGPGDPTTCHILLAKAVTVGGSVVNDSGSGANHGTNVASIVAGVAPAAKIIQMNVFGTGSSTSDVQILAAMNWAIANQAAYNIRAINMSLGDGVRHTSPCSAGNVYLYAVANARSAGIITVAAAGNDTYTDGLASPACTPGAVSVGAVYSGNFGGLGWAICTDSTTAADKVACFSNSASFLSVLAPGAIITAGGVSLGGTSQAAPFVAGSIAVLQAAYPTESLEQTVTRITASGVPVLDARNGLSKPRLDLQAAAGVSSPETFANQDVPTLPDWATIIGALLIISVVFRRQRRATAR